MQSVWRAGSAPPPAQTADDKDADEADARADADRDQEPRFFGVERDEKTETGGPSPRREPTIMPPPAAAAAGLKADGRRKLESALDDLIACRRLIDAALTKDYSGAPD